MGRMGPRGSGVTRIQVDLTKRQIDVLHALAFLDERRGKGQIRKQLQALVDDALETAELDPDVRAALRARRPFSEASREA